MSLCFAVVLLSSSPLLRSLPWLLFANIDFADIERFSVIFLGDKLRKSSHDARKGRDCGMRIRDCRLLGSLSVPLPHHRLRLSLSLSRWFAAAAQRDSCVASSNYTRPRHQIEIGLLCK